MTEEHTERDHHTDEDASVNDERIKVEQSGVGIDIVREMYGMVGYEPSDDTTAYAWHEDERFHIRADNVPELLSGIESIDVEYLQDSLEQLQEVEAALSGDSNE